MKLLDPFIPSVLILIVSLALALLAGLILAVGFMFDLKANGMWGGK